VKPAAKTILVVEDDSAVRDFLADCLRSEGYKVLTACDGKEGLALARARRPGLVILDLIMPEMHGFEVCEHLRQDERTKAVKILISSVKSYPADRKAAKGLGADRYLAKPYTTDDLLDAVKALIG